LTGLARVVIILMTGLAKVCLQLCLEGEILR